MFKKSKRDKATIILQVNSQMKQEDIDTRLDEIRKRSGDRFNFVVLPYGMEGIGYEVEDEI